MYKQRITKKFSKLQSQPIVTVLGIETSCDETAISIVRNGTEVVSDILYSQADTHSIYGGVVPEIASRAHAEKIIPLVETVLGGAKLTLGDIDAIAVTTNPGLIGALIVGVSAAKALSYAAQIPLVSVNHIEGHICANFLECEPNSQATSGEYNSHTAPAPPFVAVVVSGGHTAIYRVDDYTVYTYLGGTSDDAIGECFDKVARVLGLPYPGGPEIDRRAKLGSPSISLYKKPKVVRSDHKLSYSGLKTAAINYLHNIKQKGETVDINDFCASLTAAAVDLLIDTVISATLKSGLDTIAIAGGVAANSYLRDKLPKIAETHGISVKIPPLKHCTDNAAMIASRAYYSIKKGQDLCDLDLNAGIV